MMRLRIIDEVIDIGLRGRWIEKYKKKKKERGEKNGIKLERNLAPSMENVIGVQWRSDC